MAKIKGRRGNKNTVSGFFREIYTQNPSLLAEKSNEGVFKMWLEKNPDQTEVPDKVRQNHANVKSSMRKKHGIGKRGRKAGATRGRPRNGTTSPGRVAGAGALRKLEEAIDECLTTAKGLDRATLGPTIDHLREARNEVVVHLKG